MEVSPATQWKSHSHVERNPATAIVCLPGGPIGRHAPWPVAVDSEKSTGMWQSLRVGLVNAQPRPHEIGT